MTFTQTSDPVIREHIQCWRTLDVEQQLGLFWFIYQEMGDSITPAAPYASTISSEIAAALFNEVEQLSPEEQLQIQRDLINQSDNLISREYASLNDTTKLLFWYLLAQGIDSQTIISIPANFQLSLAAENLFNRIKELSFEQQITLFRDYVSPMGTETKTGADI
jgi:hypothetical protein